MNLYLVLCYLFIFYDKYLVCLKKFKNKVTINLHVSNYLGQTSLHWASEKGHMSMVELLLDRGANIDQKDRDGEFILSSYLCIYLKII